LFFNVYVMRSHFQCTTQNPWFSRNRGHIRCDLPSDSTHILTRRLQFLAVQKCWWWPYWASRICLSCVLRCIGHAKAFSVPNPEPLIFEKPLTHKRCYLSSDTTHTLTRRLQFWAGQKCWWWPCQASRRFLCCVLWCIGHAKAFSVPNPEPLIFEKPSTHIWCYLSSDTTHTLTRRLQFWAVQKCLWWSYRALRRWLCCVRWCIGQEKAFSVSNPEPLIFEKPWTLIRCDLSSDTTHTLTRSFQFWAVQKWW
jgi:hypothetical protein